MGQSCNLQPALPRPESQGTLDFFPETLPWVAIEVDPLGLERDSKPVPGIDAIHRDRASQPSTATDVPPPRVPVDLQPPKPFLEIGPDPFSVCLRDFRIAMRRLPPDDAPQVHDDVEIRPEQHFRVNDHFTPPFPVPEPSTPHPLDTEASLPEEHQPTVQLRQSFSVVDAFHTGARNFGA